MKCIEVKPCGNIVCSCIEVIPCGNSTTCVYMYPRSGAHPVQLHEEVDQDHQAQGGVGGRRIHSLGERL